MLFRTGFVVEWNIDHRPITAKQIRRLGCEVEYLLLFSIFETVEAPGRLWLSCLGRLVVLEGNAIDCVGFGG